MGLNLSKTESSTSTPVAGSINPVSGLLANLFGVPTGVFEGGFSAMNPNAGPMTASRAAGPFAEQAFGPGSFESIANLLQPQNLGAQYIPGIIQGIGEGAAAGQDFWTNTLMPAATEGLETGFLSDDVASRAIRQAQGNLAHQYGQQMGGLSSDFLAQSGETEADIWAQLEMARAGNRADILPVAAMLPGAQTQQGYEAGIAGLNLGEQLILDATSGGRAMTLMQLLAGLQPTSAIPRGNIGGQSGWGWAGQGPSMGGFGSMAA